MILIKIIIYVFLFFFSFKVYSISLTDQLHIFFKKNNIFKNNINIIIRTPLKQNKYCKKPTFSVLNDANHLGLVNVLLTCGEKHEYLEVEVQEHGEYIVANKKIPRGTTIQESDLKVLIGRIDMLPNKTYLNKQDVINRVNLRDIFPLEPITSFMTRPFWLVKFNQKVTVIFNGNNFTISFKAQALNNGAKNDTIRLKTKTGKIITGIVNNNGQVVVSL